MNAKDPGSTPTVAPSKRIGGDEVQNHTIIRSELLRKLGLDTSSGLSGSNTAKASIPSFPSLLTRYLGKENAPAKDKNSEAQPKTWSENGTPEPEPTPEPNQSHDDSS